MYSCISGNNFGSSNQIIVPTGYNVLANLVVPHDKSDYSIWKSDKAERILVLIGG
jgi:hypothetical protein